MPWWLSNARYEVLVKNFFGSFVNDTGDGMDRWVMLLQHVRAAPAPYLWLRRLVVQTRRSFAVHVGTSDSPRLQLPPKKRKKEEEKEKRYKERKKKKKKLTSP